jgi:dTDP-4-amino-4,6-dideoxygalactose transaminase
MVSISTQRSYRIPLMRPQLPTADELLPYLRIIDENRIYSNFGPLNELLQERIAKHHFDLFGRHVHVVTTNNGTSAIELLLQSLRLPPGSTVLVPALTFVATCTAAQRMGYRVVVADVDAESWLMTPESLSGVCLDGIAAAIPVSTFGAPQSAAAWSDWSKRTGVKVIIDAAAGFGYQDVAPDVPATFSLHATKSLGAAEGGFIVTCDQHQAMDVKKLSNFGMPDVIGAVGTNAKLSEYHAAVALSALDVWRNTVSLRSRLRQEYCEQLAGVFASGALVTQTPFAAAPSVFLVRFSTNSARERCIASCERASIGTRVWYTPLINQHPSVPGTICASHILNAKFLSERLLGLPFYPGLPMCDVEAVAAVVTDAIKIDFNDR